MLWIRSFKDNSKDLKLVWLSIFCLFFGFGIYNAVYYNFLTESIKIQPEQLGYVEAIRELPGFLCVFVTALAARLAAPVLGAFALVLMGIGMFAYSSITGIHSLMLWSLVWSMGFHVWYPIQPSLVLKLSKDGQEGKSLGESASIASLGMVLGMVIVSKVGYILHFSTWFIIGAVLVACASVSLLFVKKEKGRVERPKLIWKKRYGLYYALTFLEGCRKQVFMTFAIYALTREYGTKLQVVAILMVINGIVNMFGSPIFGRLIDRIGERKLLMICYTSLIFVFIGYATIHRVHMLYVLYCLDNLFFLSSPCLTTYLKKIAEPRDLMPTISMGVTLNHTAAVSVPLIGGLLWATVGYPATFFGGAVVVGISVLLASRVKYSIRETGDV